MRLYRIFRDGEDIYPTENFETIGSARRYLLTLYAGDRLMELWSEFEIREIPGELSCSH